MEIYSCNYLGEGEYDKDDWGLEEDIEAVDPGHAVELYMDRNFDTLDYPGDSYVLVGVAGEEKREKYFVEVRAEPVFSAHICKPRTPVDEKPLGENHDKTS